MRRVAILILFCVLRVFAQPESGELRLRITDSSGVGVRGTVELRSDVSGFATTGNTDPSGRLAIQHVPFGIYSIRVTSGGFAPFTETVGVHSALPIEVAVQLSIQAPSMTVNVNDQRTLLDPDEPTSVQRIGSAQIEDRPAALPGRSLQDLVNQQPGWLYEGNAVLHPRGSEYQAQYVVDGIPLTENRSPGVGPEFDAEDVASMSVYTAGYPAEFGRKLGGVIEINTARDAGKGLHGDLQLAGGSFDTRESYARMQDQWGANTLTISGNAGASDWFLNPPVLQNFTNSGTDGSGSISYERDLNARDRVSLVLRHDQSRFQVPDELIQAAAGQRQDRGTDETIGNFGFQHIFNQNLLADVRFMARSVDATLQSNTLSTPIIAAQDRSFDEQYLKSTVSYHRGMHEWKAGIEADFASVEERFSYTITDAANFDASIPRNFLFVGEAPDREQSAFVQDTIDLGDWTASLGVRWDHYQLLVNQHAVSPRLGISRAFPKLGLILHASYDRIFQTPAAENLLLSSSPQVAALNPQVLRLPVKPSLGNYFEFGGAKEFGGAVKLDLNYFHRAVSNFADDDLLLNTSVAFPIAFRKANIYGGEAKLELAPGKRFSGFASYSYLVGHAFLPVTGGLFLGSDANDALSKVAGSFAISQDQRNTIRTRLRYDITPRIWASFSTSYGSGLPVEFDGTRPQALAQYGPAIVGQVNFDRARVRPNFSMDISASAELWKREKKRVRVQGDIENLTNRLNLINFAGLFSGNTLEPPRTYHARLVIAF